MMPVLRFILVALLVASPIAVLGMRVRAEPLDKASCATLAAERRKLLTPSMQAALDRGPDWVKDHLNDADLDKVRQFLDVEAKIDFRCRDGGIDWKASADHAKPDDTDTVPLPDRKPTLEPTTTTTGSSSSQTVADSDKTAPSKNKATR